MSEPTAAELLKDVGLKAKNLKCFGEEPQGFDRIMPINVIIGRNNSGKSALIDLVEYVVTGKSGRRWEGRHGQNPQAIQLQDFDEETIDKLVPKRSTRMHINGPYESADLEKFALNRLPGTKLHSVVSDNGKIASTSIEPRLPVNHFEQICKEIEFRIANRLVSRLHGRPFRRLLADRNIKEEAELPDGGIFIDADGSGFTSAIEYSINRGGPARTAVEQTIVNGLNAIFSAEGRRFTRLVVEFSLSSSESASPDDTPWRMWEIKLEEDGENFVSLGQMGSGLKTTLLVLANLHLMPIVYERPTLSSDGPFVFAFEELENNLHPTLFRRLLDYITTFTRVNKCTTFLTTHSNVAIDFFSKEPDAQIVHVTRDGSESKATTICLRDHGNVLLDDLGVRASDLLQTNIVIWVEGPSDRVYLNKWIELASDGEIKQGTHYQIVFYGGSILARHSFEREENEERDLVEAIKVCRNAILIGDSDKEKLDDPLQDRLVRTTKEITAAGGYAWITEGRVIENYIPKSVLLELKAPIGRMDLQFGNIWEKCKKLRGVGGDKVALARQVADLLTLEAIGETLDLRKQIDAVVGRIREANGMAIPSLEPI